MEVNTLLNKESAGTCSVCRKELTAFGSKELSDAVLCRECAEKLSEWLTDEALKDCKVSGIEKHLSYRQKNAQRLSEFKEDKKTDGKYKLYIDEGSRSFVISKKKDYVSDNADVVKLSAIRSIKVYDLPVENGEGKNIFVEVSILSRFVKKIHFKVNEFSGLIEGSEEYKKAKDTAEEYINLFLQEGVNERKVVREYGE